MYLIVIPLAAPNASSSAWKPSACAPPKPPKMVTSSTALAEGAIATVAATASAVNEAIENFFIRYFLSNRFKGFE
ncbi:unannotated protein [freshwater metagenome]|uniref:Unannotated protein n=1 Tax=freshwater metagenome TaxID=449393 RepID=A0A6J6CIT7_9ZZZZ